jgi:hypothetical protein
VPTAAKAKETWSFDGEGRWVQRVIYSWNGSVYVAQSTNRFIWDGNILASILDQNNSPFIVFQRGLDLRGSMQRSGGAGGLLAANISTNGCHFCAYDGIGNVVALLNSSDGSVSGAYAFDSNGKTLRACFENAFFNFNVIVQRRRLL